MIVFNVDICDLIDKLNELIDRYEKIFNIQKRLFIYENPQNKNIDEMLNNIKSTIDIICEKIKGA